MPIALPIAPTFVPSLLSALAHHADDRETFQRRNGGLPVSERFVEDCHLDIRDRPVGELG